MNSARKSSGEEFSVTVPVKLEEGDIGRMIYTVRGVQVMLDRDLAGLYQVETKQLNRQVKRNIERFPEDFMFQITKEEWEELKTRIIDSNSLECVIIRSLGASNNEGNWKCQNATSNSNPTLEKQLKMGVRRMPYVFTEEGVSQLSSVLKSQMAAQTSIRIMRAFSAMRRYIMSNAGVFQRIESLEQFRLETRQNFASIETRFDQVLDRMEDGTLKARLGIFFEGQMFDAFVLVETLFKRAIQRIVLIDDYVSGDILQRMRVRPGLSATIDCYVRDIHRTVEMEQAFRAYNTQYPDEHCQLHTFNKVHDRFLIIDDEVYHFGASIKDLGKRWFGVNLITEHTADELIARLQSPGSRDI